MRHRASKYGNTRTPYGGRVFASKREAEHAAELDMLKAARDPAQRVETYRCQVPFNLVVNGDKVCAYVADFVVKYADGREEVQDVKGFRTDVYKIKRKLFRALYGREIVEY